MQLRLGVSLNFMRCGLMELIPGYFVMPLIYLGKIFDACKGVVPVSIRLRERCLTFAGLCFRAGQSTPTPVMYFIYGD